MKQMTYMLTLGLFAATLASCNTYVEGRGHTRAGYEHRDHRSHSGPSYSGRPSHRSSNSLINANANLGAGLRL